MPLLFFVDISSAASVYLPQKITEPMSSHTAEGAHGFTVRTIYCCDVCGFEVSDQEKIVQHLADCHKGTKSVCLELALPQQQDDVTSSSPVLPPQNSIQKSTHALTEQSSGQIVSVDSKSLVCPMCGRIYKYMRCFNRHVERMHNVATHVPLLQTVGELQCKALTASSDMLNSANCKLSQGNSADSSTDGLLNDAEEFRLQEVTGILDEVLASVSDNKKPVEQAPKSQMDAYCCAECPKQFKTRRSFQLHTTDIHTGWTFACKWCGRLFREGSQLHSHAITVHGKILDDVNNTDLVEPVLHSHCCTVCRFRYHTEEDLAKHMASHADTLPAFACSMCSGRYFTEYGLRCHTQRVHSGDSPYACELCGDRFATASERTVHLRHHDPHLCTVCGVRLRRRTHGSTDVGDTLCNVCYLEQLSSRDGVQVSSEATSTKTVMQNHARTSTLPLKYSCNTCGIKFAWSSNLRRHERKHAARKLLTTGSEDSEGQLFQCSYCARVFKQADSLQKHILRHVEPSQSKQPAFSCKLCGQRFLWKRGLNRHFKNVHSPSLAVHIPVATSASSAVQCNSAVASSTSVDADTVCLDNSRDDHDGDQSGSSGTCLHHHILDGDTISPSEDKVPPLKSDQELLACPECGSAFFWRSNVMRHIREQHREIKTSYASREEKHLQCNKCGRRFSRLGYLRVHLKAHENVEKRGGVRMESLLCSQCGQKMSSARLLHIHMLRHSGVRPHQCKLCDKSFFEVSQLNAHLSVVHRGNRFICDQCGHKANSKAALKIHCRTAHPVPGVQPSFSCLICSRRYWTQSALQRHAVAHDVSRLSIRKAMCSVCSLVFRHVYNLAHHIKTTHDHADCATPFACATCCQQFETGQEFKTHYRSKHRNR